MIFKASTPHEEIKRQIYEHFVRWNRKKAASFYSKTMGQCTDAVFNNPEEGIYAL